MRSTRRRILRGISGAALTASLCAGLLALPASPAAALPGQADSQQWELAWADEFNGAPHQPGDAWTYEVGNAGNYNSGNKELQYYTKDADNAQTDGDNLVITARRGSKGLKCAYVREDNPGRAQADNPDPAQRKEADCDYTSARITTQNAPFAQSRYGRIESRIKLPGGKGLLPAFWALGTSQGWPNGGEMDILESVAKPECLVCSGLIGPNRLVDSQSGDARFSHHWGNGSKNKFQKLTNKQLSEEFHVYAMDWFPDRVTFSVDGMLIHEQRKADVPQGSWVFDRPFYVVLNLAVGGGWPKDPPPETSFPQKMYVDYVRLYQPKRPLVEATGTIRSPYAGDKCIDVVGASTANSTPLQTLNCKNNPAQRWSVKTDGTVRSALGADKCLDVRTSGTTDGTPVQLYECNGSGAQQWVAQKDGKLRNPNSGKCLHISHASTAESARLEIYQCIDTPAEVWTLPVSAEWPLHDRLMDPADLDKPSTEPMTARNANSTTHDLTLTCTNGADWTDDTVRGVSARFDGTSGSCSADKPVVNTSDNFTVSAWVKLDSVDQPWNRTLVSQDGKQTSGFHLQYDATAKKWAFKRMSEDSASPQGNAGVLSTAPAGTEWTHLAGVYSAATNTISLYVNGRPQGAPVKLAQKPWEAKGAFVIGRGKWAGTAGDYFPGRISSVRASTVDLSPASVGTLYREDVHRMNLELPKPRS
ncbi:putative glycoside hydrolase [Streptomyces sp. NBRC 110611]|uniref:LamG-like jellyroll fold domain-containing protein n=1 Tax=Streptomyces sp. NBRC 110611 TaxID=1621259 RepID=UPI000829A7AD|nr:LamG-like jellyroll fold domain-containing protein [Streptomyces sp. NBRC 110611]GAU66887.1 putative glycoside hydrolase [Streptomyces sp. NBRC 110611]